MAQSWEMPQHYVENTVEQLLCLAVTPVGELMYWCSKSLVRKSVQFFSAAEEQHRNVQLGESHKTQRFLIGSPVANITFSERFADPCWWHISRSGLWSDATPVVFDRQLEIAGGEIVVGFWSHRGGCSHLAEVWSQRKCKLDCNSWNEWDDNGLKCQSNHSMKRQWGVVCTFQRGAMFFCLQQS